ncbi:hypothetical protein [Rhizobium rhizogenes]|nr:hypothetical protein [Rhizobium rhizogenes]
MPLIDILSADRFSTYLLWANNDVALAERLYSYNVQLSADFYSSLHMLEIALRNRCDAVLTTAHGAAWFDSPTVLKESYQRQCIKEARALLLREGKSASHGQMIAELNFGFWSSLFGRSSNHLWGILRPIFNTGGLQRATIAQKLRDLRRLRNRIAHYEPILAQPLTALHADVLNLTSWMSVEAAAWITTHSNVAYSATMLIIPDPVNGQSVFDMALIGHVPI